MAYFVEKLEIAGAAQICLNSFRRGTLPTLRFRGPSEALRRDVDAYCSPPSLKSASWLKPTTVFLCPTKIEFFKCAGQTGKE
jgi:hypothetical protein